jgi:hypothetical protein
LTVLMALLDLPELMAQLDRKEYRDLPELMALLDLKDQ